MVRLFSHEVTDVEPVLGMLSQQNPQDHEVCHLCSFYFYIVNDVTTLSIIANVTHII